MKNLKILIACFTFIAFHANAEVEKFEVMAPQCTTLVTKNGSLILIPSHIFLKNNTPYNGKVIIEFKSYLDQLDIAMDDISMSYQNKHLQSGGMYRISWTNLKKDSLKIQKGKKIIIKFVSPTQFEKSGLEHFYYDTKNKTWLKLNGDNSNHVVTDHSNLLWNKDGDRPVQDQDIISNPDGDDPELGTLDSNYWKRMAILKQAYKTMGIDKMGLYNYDKIFDESTAIPLFVSLKDEHGDTISLINKTLYVIYKNTNTVIYYSFDDIKNKKFNLLAQNNISIFILDNFNYKLYKVTNKFTNSLAWVNVKNNQLILPFETFKLKNDYRKQELKSILNI